MNHCSSSNKNENHQTYTLRNIFKVLGFIIFIAFILIFPLGDPEEACSRCNDDHRMKCPIAVFGRNYVCNIYKAVSTLSLTTSKTTMEVSKFTSQYVAYALYDLKLKLYCLLSFLDQEDLCRSVCCSSDEINDRTTSKNPCTCKGKCNAKAQPQHKHASTNIALF